MTVSVARLAAVVWLASASLYGRISSDLLIPGWCGATGAITVYEAGFHPSDKAIQHYNRGTAEQFPGNTAAAIRHYQISIEWEPKFTAAQNNLAKLFLETREAAAALTLLEDAVQTHPACASLYTNLAMSYIMTGRPADGEAAARRARSLNPADPHNPLIALASLIQNRPTPEVVRVIQQATPEHHLSILRLAADLAVLGEVQHALNLLERYLEIGDIPHDARERARVGVALLKQQLIAGR